jgi:transposase
VRHRPRGPQEKKTRKNQSRNEPTIDLKAELKRICGVDLTSIDGINVITAQTIRSEVGTDRSGFPTENHSTSWLGLTPNKDISGGKSSDRERVKCKTGLLCQSAWPPPPY